MEENMIMIRDHKTFSFNFDWPRDADENKIENEVEQLLLKYKHGNNIHKHGKQQNKVTT